MRAYRRRVAAAVAGVTLAAAVGLTVVGRVPASVRGAFLVVAGVGAAYSLHHDPLTLR
ncbi:hypothetical protein [Halobaculum sp. D14]|uniref:hypothetical protein n=1 Tax=unclassified Halobaculum TaxID=2640896 RepID=UPI003EBB5D7C